MRLSTRCRWMSVVLWGFALAAAAAPSIQKTDRGAAIETDRYRATLENGVLVSFFNKLTGEEYLDTHADLSAILPHLPSGLGTRATPEAAEGSKRLYVMPWWELPPDMNLPNQRFPTGESRFEFVAREDGGATLVYRGLSDGQGVHAKDNYFLDVAVDADTGDLLLTPRAAAAEPGVYGVNLSVQAIGPAITIEAPIFDGVRITRDMPPQLWINMWGNYWDYAFLALNGQRRGAVGIWCQDKDLKIYKHLFYLINQEGISFSLSTLNIPPFETLKGAQGMTWRFQAFDKSWAQAAARFRAWRLANVDLAPRAEWTRHVSFVNMGVNGSRRWMDRMAAFLDATGDKEKLARTVTFAPTIRWRTFDTAHFDNEPHKGFKENMADWKASGAKLMAYLQPMIMNPSGGNGAGPTEEQKKIVAIAGEANTVYAFNPDPKFKWLTAQHHLGYAPWQDWMLGCVHDYIAKHDADGVYHDQSYITPVDNRGLVNGMTSCQGMADYFRKAALRDPDSIHGTEHLTELNSTGASLGIGSSVHWGTAKAMRGQRIRHASPVCNALHYPNATLFGFPHFVDGPAANEAFNMGMELAERRGEIPGNNLQSDQVYPASVPAGQWVNDFRVKWLRATTFVNHGLRPVFPEDWDRTVRSYFQGVKGASFRYESTPWGSRFVRTDGRTPVLVYGRIHGVTELNTARGAASEAVETALLGAPLVTNGPAPDAGIAGWPMYNPDGPSGLNPDTYYVLDPAVKPPATHFSGSLYEGCLEDGTVGEKVAFLRLGPVAGKGGFTSGGTVILNAPAAPANVWVYGRPAAASPAGEGRYAIGFRTWTAQIMVLLAPPSPGFADLRSDTLCRAVSDRNLDLFDQNWMRTNVTVGTRRMGSNTVATVTAPPVGFACQMHIAVTPPAAATHGIVKAHLLAGNPLTEFALNGSPQDIAKDRAKAGVIEVPLKAGDSAVLTFASKAALSVGLEWVEAGAPAK